MSKLLLLPLLLLVLTLAAISVHAAKVTITLPAYNKQIWHGMVGVAWRVDPTQPMETWDGIAKVEYWLNGVLEHTDEYPHPPDPNAKGPLSILSWTYDGRADGAWSTDAFEIHVWVWKQTWVYFPFPPTITWSQLAVTPDTMTQYVHNWAPTLSYNYEFAPNRAAVTYAGTVTPNDCAVTLGGEAVTVGASGTFNKTVPLSPGDTALALVATDPATCLVTTMQDLLFRSDPETYLSTSQLDLTTATSLTATVTVPTTCDVIVDVWDPMREQLVKSLGAVEAQVNTPEAFNWDGTADPSYVFTASNGRVLTGSYQVRIVTLPPADGRLDADPAAVAYSDVTVTNIGDSFGWDAVVEAESSGITRSGDWTVVGCDRFYSSCAIATTASAGSPTVSMGFSGTQIDVIFVAAPCGGIATIKVDGAVVTTADLDSQSDDFVFNQVVQVTGISPGQHQLLIEFTPSGENGVVVLDAVRTYQD